MMSRLVTKLRTIARERVTKKPILDLRPARTVESHEIAGFLSESSVADRTKALENAARNGDLYCDVLLIDVDRDCGADFWLSCRWS